MLARTFGCVRLVRNRTLAERRRRYHGEGKGLSYAASDAALTVMTPDSRASTASSTFSSRHRLPA